MNAQNDLITAQIALVESERNVVVASYALLMSTGRMTASQMGLQVAEYKPEEHYKAVRTSGSACARRTVVDCSSLYET